MWDLGGGRGGIDHACKVIFVCRVIAFNSNTVYENPCIIGVYAVFSKRTCIFVVNLTYFLIFICNIIST